MRQSKERNVATSRGSELPAEQRQESETKAKTEAQCAGLETGKMRYLELELRRLCSVHLLVQKGNTRPGDWNLCAQVARRGTIRAQDEENVDQ
jgi:hypothetical protein